MLGLKNLRGNTEADVAGFLDAAIHINIAVVHNKDQEVRSAVVAITSCIPGLLDCTLLVLEHSKPDDMVYLVLPHRQGCLDLSRASCRTVGASQNGHHDPRRSGQTFARKTQRLAVGVLADAG